MSSEITFMTLPLLHLLDTESRAEMNDLKALFYLHICSIPISEHETISYLIC